MTFAQKSAYRLIPTAALLAVFVSFTPTVSAQPATSYAIGVYTIDTGDLRLSRPSAGRPGYSYANQALVHVVRVNMSQAEIGPVVAPVNNWENGNPRFSTASVDALATSIPQSRGGKPLAALVNGGYFTMFRSSTQFNLSYLTTLDGWSVLPSDSKPVIEERSKLYFLPSGARICPHIDLYGCRPDAPNWGRPFIPSIQGAGVMLPWRSNTTAVEDATGPNSRRSRTVIGFNDQYLFLVTIDEKPKHNRNPREGGVTAKDAANIMSHLKAHSALQLDGGGSSQMWTRRWGLVSANGWIDSNGRIRPRGLVSAVAVYAP